MNKDDLEKKGYLDLGNFHPGLSTIDVARIVGDNLKNRIDGDVESLTVNAVGTKPKNTYGGNYGRGALPLHTDLAHWYTPPKYFLLRCVVADPQVFTLLLHSREVLKILPAALIIRALFRPRRRLDGKMYFLRLRADGIFRWDQLFLTPENIEAEQIRDTLTNRLHIFAPERMGLDTPGKTLLVDNWNMLHARSSIHTATSSRCIDRVYFSEE